MVERNFTPHGKIQVSVDNNLVTLEIEGPCNTEFFQQMAQQLFKVRDLLDLNNYTALIVLHGEALATQEAMSFFTDYLKTISARAVAINLEYALTPMITQTICHQAYSEAGIKHQFFYNNDSAITWLRACMAKGK